MVFVWLAAFFLVVTLIVLVIFQVRTTSPSSLLATVPAPPHRLPLDAISRWATTPLEVLAKFSSEDLHVVRVDFLLQIVQGFLDLRIVSLELLPG
jgi:hypothetical protein